MKEAYKEKCKTDASALCFSPNDGKIDAHLSFPLRNQLFKLPCSVLPFWLQFCPPLYLAFSTTLLFSLSDRKSHFPVCLPKSRRGKTKGCLIKPGYLSCLLISFSFTFLFPLPNFTRLLLISLTFLPKAQKE